MKFSVAPTLACLMALSASAASEPPSPADIVRAAHAAAGGESWVQPRTLRLSGRAVLYDGGRHRARSEADDYRMWRVFPEWNNAAHEASGRVRVDVISDGRTLFQIAYDGKHTYNQHGRMAEADAERQWRAAFGFGIIRFALEDGFSLTRMADDQVRGHDTYVIAVSDSEEGETLFWIDRDDHRIRKVGFDTPRGWHERIYSDFEWHRDPDFLQPTRVRLYYDGRLTNDVHWLEYAVDEPIDPSVFTLGSGHSVSDDR